MRKNPVVFFIDFVNNCYLLKVLNKHFKSLFLIHFKVDMYRIILKVLADLLLIRHCFARQCQTAKQIRLKYILCIESIRT